MERFLSRKFITQVLAMATASLMLWHGKLDGATWAMLVGALAGVYGAANVAEKRGQK